MSDLNPRSAAKRSLADVERVLVPEPEEFRNALQGNPATRPSTAGEDRNEALIDSSRNSRACSSADVSSAAEASRV